jgi:hypothetical protein
LSATVIGPELMWADVHATAAFVRGASATPPEHHALALVTVEGRLITR